MTKDQVACLLKCLPDQLGHLSNVVKVEYQRMIIQPSQRVAKLLLINTLVCVNFKSKAKQSNDTVVDSYVCHPVTLRSCALWSVQACTATFGIPGIFYLFSGELGFSKKVCANNHFNVRMLLKRLKDMKHRI